MLRYVPSHNLDLNYPGTGLACTNGGGLVDGVLVTGYKDSPYLHWYDFTPTPSHLLERRRFPLWEGTWPEDSLPHLVSMAIGPDCARMYSLLMYLLPARQYSLWLHQYELDVDTGDIEVVPSYIPLPMPIPKAFKYDLGTAITSLATANPKIQANGYLGVPIAFDGIERFCHVCVYNQYVISIYPIYFEDYAEVYQILAVMDSLTGRLVGAFYIGCISQHDERTSATSALKTGMWIIDGYLWFQSSPIFMIPEAWNLPMTETHYPNPRLGNADAAWPELREAWGKYQPMSRIYLPTLLGQLNTSTIYNPIWLVPTTLPLVVNNLVVTDHYRLASDVSGMYLYGLTETALQEYRIEYIGIEVNRGSGWVSSSGFMQNFWHILTGVEGTFQVRLSNLSEHTNLSQVIITVPVPFKVAISGNTPTGMTVTLASLPVGGTQILTIAGALGSLDKLEGDLSLKYELNPVGW